MFSTRAVYGNIEQKNTSRQHYNSIRALECSNQNEYKFMLLLKQDQKQSKNVTSLTY